MDFPLSNQSLICFNAYETTNNRYLGGKSTVKPSCLGAMAK